MRHPQRVYLFICEWCQQQHFSPQSKRDAAEQEARRAGWGLLGGEWHCSCCLPLLKSAEKRKRRPPAAPPARPASPAPRVPVYV